MKPRILPPLWSGELPLGFVARTALSQPSEKKRRILTLPRPRLVCVLALLDKYERMGKDERKRELPRFDGRLRNAVTDDMAAYVGEVMSSVAFRGGRKGVHGVRTVQELSSFGWTEVLYPYRRGTDDRPDFRRAFGIERKMTPCASETVSRLAVQLSSFKEARDALALLGCGRMSVSKVRDETLATGRRILEEQRRPPKDVRRYTEAQTRTPEGGRAVRRTLVAMADGTNVPCVKKDTKGVRDKNGDEAHSRRPRVMNFFEYCNVDGKGTPVPIRGAFSYAATDGEEALEKALRDTFPFAEFTNDVMHACGYLSACCQALGIASPAKEYATCRRIMFCHGAGSAVDRIRRLHPKELEASKEARAALDDLDKRRENMRYGWLRRNGYCISSSHVEASARILVARRCKQAGMHWHHHNAACVCAIIARRRSVA